MVSKISNKRNELLKYKVVATNKKQKPDVLHQLGNNLCIGVRFELVTLGFQEPFDVLVVGDDTIVHN